MNKNDFEKEYSNEIEEIKGLFQSLEIDKEHPDIETIRKFVRTSKNEIEQKKKRNYNVFRASALVIISILIPALNYYPLQVLSLSLLSIFVMPIVLVLSSEEKL
jgi:hypothetical protein